MTSGQGDRALPSALQGPGRVQLPADLLLRLPVRQNVRGRNEPDLRAPVEPHDGVQRGRGGHAAEVAPQVVPQHGVQ